MIYLHLVCFVFIGLHCVCCHPIETENSFYNAITEKCPSLQSDATYKKHPIFRVCKDWKTIGENKLTTSSANEIRCLFYYNSLTEYCSKSAKINTTVPLDVLTSYNYQADKICDYAKTVRHTKLKAFFSTENNCKHICFDELGLSINSICGMAYYFACSTVPQLPDSSGPSEPNGTQKNYDTAQNSQVPSSENSQSSGNSHLPATLEKSRPSQVENTVVHTKNSAIDPEQNKPKSNVVNNNIEPQQKGQQNQNLDESKANPSHLLNQAENSAPTVPKLANNSPVEAAAVHEEQLYEEPTTAPVVPPTQQQKQKPAMPQNQDGPVNSNVDKIEGTYVDRPVKPPIEKSDASNLQNVKPVTQSTKGNGKPEVKPANSPDVVETDNRDIILQDSEEEKQTLENQQMPNQDSETDDLQSEKQDDDTLEPMSPSLSKEKPLRTDDEPGNYNTEMEGDSYFFTYFMLLCIIFIVGYVCYHNKQKVLALVLEGRKGRRQYRGRRPNSANYHKLDSNLEEAITSSCQKNTNNVIY